jgi:hypothetical protein
MAQNELVAFIEAARRSGIADTAIAAVLESSGWPRKDVFAAMRAHYEALAGVPVPVRRGVGETARDAFLHLLAFGTLATWALALGGLLFGWVELTWPDRVIDGGGYTQRHILAGNLASLIVAFPVYLLATRQALREKRDSAVRRWLTWTALLIAAGIVIGDVIAVLAALLRGETTVRFLLKAWILVLSLGIARDRCAGAALCGGLGGGRRSRFGGGVCRPWKPRGAAHAGSRPPPHPAPEGCGRAAAGSPESAARAACDTSRSGDGAAV